VAEEMREPLKDDFFSDRFVAIWDPVKSKRRVVFLHLPATNSLIKMHIFFNYQSVLM
jgi:hypothetical protein